MTIALWILSILLILTGIAGAVLPALPGAPLVLIGLILAAWIDHFTRVSGWTLGLLGGLTLLTYVVEVGITGWSARRYGASKFAALGAVIGAFFGLFMGIPGLIAGPFIGAFIGEFYARGDVLRAGRAGVGATVGLILGAAAKMALIVAMIGIFVLAYLL